MAGAKKFVCGGKVGLMDKISRIGLSDGLAALNGSFNNGKRIASALGKEQSITFVLVGDGFGTANPTIDDVPRQFMRLKIQRK
jgi:hypothetical protein